MRCSYASPVAVSVVRYTSSYFACSLFSRSPIASSGSELAGYCDRERVPGSPIYALRGPLTSYWPSYSPQAKSLNRETKSWEKYGL